MKRLTLLALAASAVASPYTRSTTEGGIPLWRPDAANIQFLVHPSLKAGATASDGSISITPSSDPAAALSAALGAWNAVADSALRFAPLQETTLLNLSSDRQHIMLLVDSAETRSIVGSYLAITVWSYSLADGAITDTDIIFNPRVVDNGKQVPFSTDHAAGTYDLQSVATHELGHAIGAGHSGVISSAMFQTTDAFGQFVSVVEATMQSVLTPDDVAFLLAAYPAPGAAERYGRLSGTVRFSGGAGVKVPLVVAADPSTGVVLAIAGSPANGTYSMAGVPPGKYHVYAQPLDGPVLPAYLGTAGSTQAEIFRTTFAGGNDAPTLIEVQAGGEQTVDIGVNPDPPGMHLNQVGVGSPGGMDWSFAATRAISAGRAWDVLLWGRGIDAAIKPEQILLLGPGMTVRPDSMRLQTSATVGGLTPLRFTVDVAARTVRAQAPVAVLKDGDGAANSASLVLLPGGAPPAPPAGPPATPRVAWD
jgi:hypothetical protein